MPDISFWTVPRVESLERLWADGRSCSEIGRELGCSRNAVIGKASRLGLSRRMNATKTEAEIEQKQRVRKASPSLRIRLNRPHMNNAETKDLPPAPPAYAGYLGIPFADLEPFKRDSANQCRFMAAEPAGPDYRVCGNETPIGEAWCAHCDRIVHARAELSPEEAERRRGAFMRATAKARSVFSRPGGVDEAA